MEIRAPLRAQIETRLLREIERLTDEFRGIFGQETIERYARESLDALHGSRVKDYLPVLVARFTRERLTAAAQVEGTLAKDRPEVLFVCTQNAGRSQMAAALTLRLSGGRVGVRSAGSAPAEQVHPAVVEVMAELGIDLSEAFPKPLTDEVVEAADAVITMGCGDACPIYPGRLYQDWDIDDPAGKPAEAVRRIRDQIARRVERLLSELGVVGGGDG